jgi:carbonic anhydrase/acetyltransferase-like protein (isoleucine patch superfamily)
MSIEPFESATPQIAASAFVHPAATIIGDVHVGEESSVWPGAVLRGDYGPIRIGARTSIQDNVVVHATAHGTVIGDDCVVGHLAFLEDATVQDACLVGVGAKVLNGAVMRTGSVAAAGAVLTPGKVVPSGERAQGVPAELVPAGRLSPENIRSGAAEYVRMSRRQLADRARRG